MLRHGETIGNLTKITAGSTNHSLTSNGKLQAREVAKIFNKLDLIIIYYDFKDKKNCFNFIL